MPRPTMGERPMTPTERSARRRQTQADEIRLLRRALLDALAVFDIGENTAFRRHYGAAIARAEAASNPSPRPAEAPQTPS